jgi:tetratricopeptide (TPR) repeat protein
MLTSRNIPDVNFAKFEDSDGSFMRGIFALALAGILALLASADTFAADGPNRVALVIGNAKYPDSDVILKEAVNDAQDIAAELKRDSFDVETGVNLAGEAMRQALDRLYAKIGPESVALIFFDGFGIQSGRQSYLIPVDAQIWAEADVLRDGFNLETILAEMNNRGALVKIAVLDASRRNPFERRFRRYSAGLAPAITPGNTLALYSTALGSVVGDSQNDHSLFATELLRELRVPGVSADQSLRNTQAGVMHASKGEQAPWLSSSMATDFSFTTSSDRQQQDNQISGKKTALPCETVKLDTAPSADELAQDPTIRELTRRLKVNRNDPVSHYKRGQIYAIKRAYSLAVEDFDEVVRLSPKDAEAYNNRCWTRAAIGDLQPALKDCNEALRLNPGLVDALDSRGLVNLKLGKTEDAIKDYSDALSNNPRSVSSLFGRGLAKQRSGADGSFDLNMAKSTDPGIVKEFAGYGVSECSP